MADGEAITHETRKGEGARRAGEEGSRMRQPEKEEAEEDKEDCTATPAPASPRREQPVEIIAAIAHENGVPAQWRHSWGFFIAFFCFEIRSCMMSSGAMYGGL